MNTKNNSHENSLSEYGLNTQDQRSKLLAWGKFLVYLGWILTGLAGISIISMVIILSSNFKWWQFGISFGVLIIGQGIRIVGRMIKKKSEQIIPFSGKKLILVKEKREKEVRDYFDANKDVASRVMQMNSLAKRGNYRDAYNITSSLLKLDVPQGIRDYLIIKKNKYAKLRKGK